MRFQLWVGVNNMANATIEKPVIFNSTLTALVLRKAYKSLIDTVLFCIHLEINGIKYDSYNTKDDNFYYDGRLTITYPTGLNITDGMTIRLRFEDEFGNMSDWSDFYRINTSGNMISDTTSNIDDIQKLNSIDVITIDTSINGTTFEKIELDDNVSKHHMSANSIMYQYPSGKILLSTKTFVDKIPDYVQGEQKYVLRENDIHRFDNISYKYYGTPELWWIIMAVNNIIDPFNDPYEKMVLRILPLNYVEYALLRYGLVDGQ